MVPGMPNTYSVTPLAKMKIEVLSDSKRLLSGGKSFTVLYNPQSYKMSRSLKADEQQKGKSGVQQHSAFAVLETMSVELFLDTFTASAEIIGTNTTDFAEGLKFTGNAELPSYTKQLDVRKYVNKIYDLCSIDEDSHRIPILNLTWGSLNFTCVLVSCSVDYVKFKETGVPVRARLACTFMGVDGESTATQSAAPNPMNSPDTSKFHTVQQGETLNTLSQIAYKDMDHWREIAMANGIVNPRLLKTGETLRMPALKN